MAHLVPVGPPAFLMLIIIIIETARIVIRQATLTIRLTTNIVAGHYYPPYYGHKPLPPIINLMSLIVGLITSIILEGVVVCIQSYVFYYFKLIILD